MDSCLDEGSTYMAESERDYLRERAVNDGMDPDEFDILYDARLVETASEIEQKKRAEAEAEERMDPNREKVMAVRLRKIMNANFTDSEKVKCIRQLDIPNDREDLIDLLRFSAANSRRRFIMPSVSAGWRWTICFVLAAFLTYLMFWEDDVSEEKQNDNVSVILGGMLLFGSIAAIWWGKNSKSDKRQSHNYIATAWRAKMTEALNTAQHVLTRHGDDLLVKEIKAKSKESLLAKWFH